MRLLILSDIHANLTALDAVLASCEGQWNLLACLGDVVGYGPDPNEVIDRVRGLNGVTIRGNHDKTGSGLESAEAFNPMARDAAMWTRDQLRPDNREYLEKLPAGPLIVEGVTLVHGAMLDEDEYIFAAPQALDSLIEATTPLTFFGHTHIQGGFVLRDSNNQVEAVVVHPLPDQKIVSVTIEPAATYLLNPGSVGQPRDGDPRAGFAIADLGAKVVEFWRVPYEVRSVQNRMIDAGLPGPLVTRLGLGR
jgi:predicted phosphodiesterase